MQSTSARSGTSRRRARLPLVALALLTLTLTLPACAIPHRHVRHHSGGPTFNEYLGERRFVVVDPRPVGPRGHVAARRHRHGVHVPSHGAALAAAMFVGLFFAR